MSTCSRGRYVKDIIEAPSFLRLLIACPKPTESEAFRNRDFKMPKEDLIGVLPFKKLRKKHV